MFCQQQRATIQRRERERAAAGGGSGRPLKCSASSKGRQSSAASVSERRQAAGVGPRCKVIEGDISMSSTARVAFVLLWLASLAIVGAFAAASAQTTRDTSGIISGTDIGFRPEGWKGKARIGTWMVR